MIQKKSKLWVLISLVLVAIMVLSACQPTEVAPDPVVEEPVVEEPVVEEPVVEEPVVEEPEVEEPVVEEPEVEEPVREKVVVAITGQPSRMLPSKSVGRLNEIVNSQIFESLTTYNQEQQLVGLLAESWENLDELTWEFKLRPGVEFSNGTPLTAEDVRFTYEELILDPDFGSPHRTFMATIERIEVIDDLTLHIITTTPDVLLPLRVSDIYGSVISKDHFLSFADESEYDADPIGTGPYTLVEWELDSHILYERNENYWGEMPAFKYMELRFITDDAARMSALLAGEVDVASSVPPVRVQEIEDAGVNVTVAPGNRVHYLVFDTTQPPFDDVRVRRAVSYAIDRDALINAVQFGFGVPTPSIFMPETFGFVDDLVPTYDPDRARELLAEAGYPDGFATEMDTFTGSIVDHTRTAEAVVGFLAEVGIDVTLNTAEMTVWGPERLANNTSPIYNYSFGDSLFDHGPNLMTFVSGDQGYYYEGDEEIVALIEQALGEFDLAERERLYNEIQTQFYEKGILVGLYQMSQIWGTSPDVVYEPQVDEMWRLFRIRPVDLP